MYVAIHCPRVQHTVSVCALLLQLGCNRLLAVICSSPNLNDSALPELGSQWVDALSNLVLPARLSYPNRVWWKLYYAVVLCGLIWIHYALTNSCVCGPQYVYQTTLHSPCGHQVQSCASLWTCIGLVVWVYSMSIPTVQLANTAFTRSLFG